MYVTETTQLRILPCVDNCPAHPIVHNLKSVEVRFLPPNATSFLQPMEQDVINMFKVYYRKQLHQGKLDFTVNH